MPSLTVTQDRQWQHFLLLALFLSLLNQPCVQLLRPQQHYLHHSLVGEREDLLRPLFFQFHHSVGLGDIFPPSQQLAVQKHSCLVDHDAFTFQVTARGKWKQIKERAKHEGLDAREATANRVRTVPAHMWNVKDESCLDWRVMEYWWILILICFESSTETFQENLVFTLSSGFRWLAWGKVIAKVRIGAQTGMPFYSQGE